MEQIRFFLTEYANELTTAVWGMIILLLLVTLHKIRRIGRQIRKLAETTAQMQSRMKAEGAKDTAVCATGMKQEDCQKLKSKITAEVSTTGMKQEGCEKLESKMTAEVSTTGMRQEDCEKPESVKDTAALLDAVLGEVFP